MVDPVTPQDTNTDNMFRDNDGRQIFVSSLHNAQEQSGET